MADQRATCAARTRTKTWIAQHTAVLSKDAPQVTPCTCASAATVQATLAALPPQQPAWGWPSDVVLNQPLPVGAFAVCSEVKDRNSRSFLAFGGLHLVAASLLLSLTAACKVVLVKNG